MTKLKIGFLLVLLAAGALGCSHPYLYFDPKGENVSGSDDPIAPPAIEYTITLDWKDKGTGARLMPGMDMSFAWSSAAAGSLVRLVVFRNNAVYDTTLSNYAADTGTQTWTVPLDIELHDADKFQAKLTIVDGAVQTEILEERYSPPFQIVRVGSDPGSNTGLSDVTVSARSISITLTDDGSLVDGDRVDVYLNGVKVIVDHTLVGNTGTVFTLSLLSGSNELRVAALNEGTSSPNTAQLAISDVTVGEALQSWRLLTGESGSLVVYCTAK